LNPIPGWRVNPRFHILPSPQFHRMKRILLISLCAALSLSIVPTIHADPQWIWLSKNASSGERVTLKKSFEIPGDIKSATLAVSVDNGAKALINGKSVLQNPDWSSPTKTDAKSFLQRGKNELVLQAKNDEGVAAAVAVLSVELADGKKLAIETGPDWLAASTGSSDFKPAVAIANYGAQPWGEVLAGAGAPGRRGRSNDAAQPVADPKSLITPPGFAVELLYTVPKAEQGSWVALTVDPKGRVIAGDQYGGLYRIDVTASPVKVEPLPPVTGDGGKPVTGAHGLLYAFDSLYLMVNEGASKGLWRFRDTDNDDQFDKAELLIKIDGSGEHGPHSVIVGPDKKSLWLCDGNHTKPIASIEYSRPVAWDEDHIISRMWDANGHARGIIAPGGYICKCDPDGKNVEMVDVGFRNQFDIAFDANGELFTFDSDMEWDIGAPWYRPTRIVHCTSGGDYGWRSGSGVWPDDYVDSLPPTLTVGPASPTGAVFGTGAKFPAKYQRAMYALDWTYGTMWAVHLTPEGASFKADIEEFVAGKPLPLTDAIIHPKDGAMYFAIGGRRTQSALYRVTYKGTDPTAPAAPYNVTPEAKIRHDLEALHAKGTGPEAIDKAWPYLSHKDRFLRFAARVAIEHQPVAKWADRALAERDPQASIEALVALARMGRSPEAILAAKEISRNVGISTGMPGATLPQDAELQKKIIEALGRLDFAKLTPLQRMGLLRAYELCFTRLGKPGAAICNAVAAKLNPLFPSKDQLENREIVSLLVFLDSPTIVGRVVPLLATTQDPGGALATEKVLARNEGYAKAAQDMANSRPNRQAIAYAFALRVATAGWTPELRKSYFAWFPSTSGWRGGNSFTKFIDNTRTEALAKFVPESEKVALDDLSKRKNTGFALNGVMPKGPGHGWTVDEIVAATKDGLKGRNFANGKAMYAATLCASCHHFAGEGGNIGPDLTGVGNRYTMRDLVENIVDPSKVISDQYGSEEITKKDGSLVIGRVVVQENGKLFVMASPLTPNDLVAVDEKEVVGRKPWLVSMMPPGLINSLNADELKDLLAYLLSGGNANDKAFTN
jgi:putative heme-binding domain-containing protein